jgi:hypothetical protein
MTPGAGAQPQYVILTPFMKAGDPSRLKTMKKMASAYAVRRDGRCRVVLSRKIRTKW